APGPHRKPIPGQLNLGRDPARAISLPAVHDHERDRPSPLLLRPNQQRLPVRVRNQDDVLLRVVFEAERRPALPRQPDLFHGWRTGHYHRDDEWIPPNRDRSGLAGQGILWAERPELRQPDPLPGTVEWEHLPGRPRLRVLGGPVALGAPSVHRMEALEFPTASAAFEFPAFRGLHLDSELRQQHHGVRIHGSGERRPRFRQLDSGPLGLDGGWRLGHWLVDHEDGQPPLQHGGEQDRGRGGDRLRRPHVDPIACGASDLAATTSSASEYTPYRGLHWDTDVRRYEHRVYGHRTSERRPRPTERDPGPVGLE